MPNLLARLLTRSFPGKSETQFQPLGPDVSGPAPDQPVGYESRAFKLWNDSLARTGLQSPRVLDLGKVHARTLAYFQDLGAGLGVMDLDISLKGTAFEMQLDSYRDWGPFDGVLAWDVPNYMAAEELAVLGAWLESHTSPPCPLLVCMATRTPYPDHPGRYAIVDETTLTFEPGGTEVSRTERHVPNVLKRAWPVFSSDRSFLLRNGMQEFVLTRSPIP